MNESAAVAIVASIFFAGLFSMISITTYCNTQVKTACYEAAKTNTTLVCDAK